MTLNAYAVHDAGVKHFHLPFFQQTEVEALRAFKRLVNDSKGSDISAHPQDFDLYHLGTYDGNTGKMSPLTTPVHVTKAIQMLENHPLKTLENEPG